MRASFFTGGRSLGGWGGGGGGGAFGCAGAEPIGKRFPSSLPRQDLAVRRGKSRRVIQKRFLQKGGIRKLGRLEKSILALRKKLRQGITESSGEKGVNFQGSMRQEEKGIS